MREYNYNLLNFQINSCHDKATSLVRFYVKKVSECNIIKDYDYVWEWKNLTRRILKLANENTWSRKGKLHYLRKVIQRKENRSQWSHWRETKWHRELSYTYSICLYTFWGRSESCHLPISCPIFQKYWVQSYTSAAVASVEGEVPQG